MNPYSHIHFDTFNQVIDFNCRILIEKQECIPVGCVPPLVDRIPQYTMEGGGSAYPPDADHVDPPCLDADPPPPNRMTDRQV